MKNLAFAALVLGCLGQAAGCVFVADDGDDEVIGDGDGDGDASAQFNVAWELDGGCPAGATTIQIVSDDGAPEPFEDLVDCTATGTATTSPLPLGVYDVYLNVTDDAGNRYASSLAVEAELAADGEIREVPTFAFPTDAGYMSFTWDILDADTDEPLACEDVGADNVSLTGTFVGAGPEDDFYDFEFPCADFEGTTGEMLIDDYTVVVSVNNTSGESLGTSEERSVSITYGNELVDLGNFDFAFQR